MRKLDFEGYTIKSYPQKLREPEGFFIAKGSVNDHDGHTTIFNGRKEDIFSSEEAADNHFIDFAMEWIKDQI